ncbi:PGF-pre-PGF domain-containing protein [uncultured Methanolobus sp.]|uniref:PGF-pre-PGF domain-containing protein n=1 Tax=uncultured Methanolobus sp. TaxID=218300 RepID=UPI0037480FBD
MLLSCTGIVSAATYSGGSGTSESPYLLSNDSDIDTLSTTSADWGSYFQLTQNITLVGNHTPIGNLSTQFTGNFDGNGYAVSNLTVYETTNYAGFFGCAGSGANIHDLGVEASSDGVYSNNNAGVLVGRNYGTVSSSYATGDVILGNGEASDAGGLVGMNYGAVNSSYATGNVTGGSSDGGLVGYNNGGSVNNSYATGNVTCYDWAGGLVGCNNGGTMSNSFATGNVSGSGTDLGGLVGKDLEGNVSNCYYSGSPTDTNGGISSSYDNFTSFTFVSGVSGLNWNGSGDVITTEYNSSFIWIIDDGSSLPYFQYQYVPPYSGGSGTVEDPYILSTNSDIDELSSTPENWGMNFTLTQDIVLVGNHTPIGNLSTQFTGNFNGSGYAIMNLTVYQTTDRVGFFGYAGSTSNIHDLGIETSSEGVVSTGNNVGALVGVTVGIVNNCYAIGNVGGASYVGGLAGYGDGPISNSYTAVDVIGSSDNIGGLVGRNNGLSGNVVNCYTTGNVTGNSNIGCIVGFNGGLITNSFATGTASGSGSNICGLIGSNLGTSTNNWYSSSPSDSSGTSSSFVNFTNYTFISGSSGLYWNENGNNITTADDSGYAWKIISGYTLPYFQYQDTPAPLAPYVETISTSSGVNNTDSSTSFWINLTGCSFNITDTVFVNLTMTGQTPLSGTIDSRTYTTINTTFDLTQAIAGDWSLYVINPDGQTSTAKAFTVQSMLSPESFTNTTGNFWVNHSWNAGTGIVTDSYNVSYEESWLNGTTSSFNHTGLSAHGWSNITVYAYNATYSRLSGGVSDNIQVPNNNISILNATNISTSEGETINFDINFTDADGDTATFGCNQSSLFDDFNTSTGEGSWDIGFSDAGTYYVKFNVSDGYGSIDSQVMTITVADTPTIYVGSGSDCDFTTIQAAVNAANSGNTIIVTDGAYNENVDVNKSVTLRSENGSATTNVNASDSSEHALNVTANNVTIEGFNVTGVTNFEMAGIYLGYSNDSIVRNNVVNNNSFGIVLDHSENNTLSSNIANNNSYYGIYLSSSSHNALDDNDIYNNYYGIRLSSSSDHNTLTDNTAMNNTRYGMYFGSSDNNTLTSNDANYNGRYGIYLSSSNNNTLTDNVASYNTYTYIEPASMSVGSIVEPMDISGGPATGIFIGYSAYNILNGNTANYNEGSNGVLMASNSNAVSPNGELGSAYSCGFSLYNSENITLTGNTAIGNDDYEFYSRSSTNCTIDNLEIDTGSMELSFVPIYETAIRSNETISTGPSGKSNVNGYLDIGLLEDMNMTIFYDDSGMSSSIESSVTLYKLNGNEWVAVPNATLNTSGNFVSVNLDSGVSVDIASIADYTSTYGLFKSVPSSNSGSDDDGVRASVSQGQNPAIVSNSASSVKRVTGGSEVNYDFSDSGTPVLGVSFDAKDDKGLVVSKVQVLSSTPEGVPASSGHSYQMMSIDVGSEGTISSDSAENVMIHFKVSKQWIEENDIDISTIRMTRYHGEQWNDLPTSRESEDDEYYYFYAETPGFSVFNVVGDEIGETSEQDTASASIVEEESEPVEEEETSGIPGFTAIAGVVFVLLSVILRRK